MSENLYIGIMTGTSVDAIDIAAASFNKGNIEIVAMDEFPFTIELQKYLKSLTLDISIKNISQLNICYTEEIAEIVNSFIEKYDLKLTDINAIGFHGQTLWHQPNGEEFLGQFTSSTYQLGSGSYLAQQTGIDVVSDFRTADMAVGGQGAPLIPIFDYAFLGENKIDTIVLNIGGIANITYLSNSASKNEVIAFDTGPGNCLIDLAMLKIFGKNYDEDGEIGRKGKLNKELLDRLLSEKYISQKHPKSTGKELFNNEFLERNGVWNIPNEDIITTLTHFTSKSIVRNIKMITNNEFVLKVAGGGARNSYLIEILSKNLPNTRIEKAVINGIDISDGREALLMSYLAYLRVNKLPANMPSVTGAIKEVILGGLHKK